MRSWIVVIKEKDRFLIKKERIVTGTREERYTTGWTDNEVRINEQKKGN